MDVGDSGSHLQAIDLPQPARPRVYYGWVCVGVAAAGMVATLPGRTLGLGAVAEPLLRELPITRAQFAQINLLATLIGAAFCLGIGRLIDRYGARRVCTLIGAALAAVVIVSTFVEGYWGLLIAITLTRALGQSALSVVSVAIVGKWFSRRIGLAMAVYTIALSIGFMFAISVFEYAVHHWGWRVAWASMGWIILLLFVPVAALFLRNTPESIGLQIDAYTEPATEPKVIAIHEPSTQRSSDFTLVQAMRSALFWALSACGFAFAAFFNGFVLFRESILADRGLDSQTVLVAIATLTFAGLIANFVAGWLCQRYPMGRVAGGSMIVMATAATMTPLIVTSAHAISVAVLVGLAGGGMTVVFFAAWSHIYGRSHLGRIQGVAQLLTVLGSAIGPILLAEAHERFGSYTGLFYTWAPILAAIGIWTCIAPAPKQIGSPLASDGSSA